MLISMLSLSLSAYMPYSAGFRSIARVVIILSLIPPAIQVQSAVVAAFYGFHSGAGFLCSRFIGSFKLG